MGMNEGPSNKRSTLSEINITPLVDVMLVLLIIFMVTAPLMQQGIEVNLPETTNSGVNPKGDPFVLTINAKRQVLIGDVKIPTKNLRAKLKSIFSKRKTKQVYLQADKKVDYGFVAETISEIRAAGVYSVGLLTLPKK